jgi:hypothetical protein
VGSLKLKSRIEDQPEMSVDSDPAAIERLKTLAQLVITIGRREGLIGKEASK